MGVNYYWGIVEKGEDAFFVFFPDLPGATAAGATVESALARAADVAAYHIQDMVQESRPIPDPTPLDRLPHDPDVDEHARSLVPVLIPGKAVRVNITIDEALLEQIDRAAAAGGSNRSAFLADAARDKLAPHRPR
jgi:predicted RNase H-like HicB family nuclease